VIRRRISIVLPAYDEQGAIEEQVRTVLSATEPMGFEAREVIVVNDGSGDSTGEIIDRLAGENEEIRAIHHPHNLGYADALKSGFAAARYELVFYTDSDLQFDMRELKNLLPAIDDYHLVCGFRIYRFDPLSRLILSWGYNLLVRILFRIRIRDIDCAFKLFRREIFDQITIESRNFFVDTEILAKARAHGMRMTEIGVRHYPRRAGQSTIRPSHILNTLVEIAKMWSRIYLRERTSSADGSQRT
jgi:glycosyltransferase involved in cell wall biosynthesis